jgi:hypothetical protein
MNDRGSEKSSNGFCTSSEEQFGKIFGGSSLATPIVHDPIMPLSARKCRRICKKNHQPKPKAGDFPTRGFPPDFMSNKTGSSQ